MTVYAVFFEGQGGIITSGGVGQMVGQARRDGIEASLFTYSQYLPAKNTIRNHRQMGAKIAVVGFSLGAGTACAIQIDTKVDLLVALDPSILGYNYKINKQNTKRSVLWHDSNWLLNGPLGHAGLDLGFDIVHETLDPHLYVDLDPAIQANVREELLRLKNAKS